MRVLAIIPARGGSKRIPRKNIKPFLGKPIINYSIELALSSGLFTEAMVSTDDAEIAEIAQKAGAKVPFLRSKKNADDFAGTEDVIIEVLNHYKEVLSTEFDYGCCIYPTAPLASTKALKAGFEKLKHAPVVLPVVRFGYPVLRGLVVDPSTKTLNFKWPEFENSRSQDLEPFFHDAGQWYWFHIKSILAEKTLFPKGTQGIELSELEVQDIDVDTDWKIAELKYSLLRGEG